MTLHPLSYNNGFSSQNLEPSFILDDKRRLEFSKSSLLTLLNFPKKNKLDNIIKKEVMAIFQNKYQIENVTEFKKIWKQIVPNIWSPSSILTVEKMRALDIAFQKQLIYHGKGISASTEVVNDTVFHLVRAKLHGTPLPKDILIQEAVKAVFLIKNPEFLQKFGKVVQLELENLSHRAPTNDKEAFVWRIFLGNIIALLPFYYPQTGEIIKIPILNENYKTRLVEYEIEKIELPLLDGSTPMIALGLTPTSDLEATPFLTYLGTTYPTGDGFVATLISDFTPGHSVGRVVYQKNKKTIKDWFQNKTNVKVVGSSLGGALAFHTLSHHRDKISHLDVYNPPGLYNRDWTSGIGDNVEVNIYNQAGDLVSQMGIWPNGKKVSLYSLLQHQGMAENLLNSHVHAFTGFDRITIIKQDVEKQNKSFKRRFLKKLHQIAGPIIIFPPLYSTYKIYQLTNKIKTNFTRKKISDNIIITENK